VNSASASVGQRRLVSRENPSHDLTATPGVAWCASPMCSWCAVSSPHSAVAAPPVAIYPARVRESDDIDWHHGLVRRE
jgi:hypothetical protein